jgi:hypothetical protein
LGSSIAALADGNFGGGLHAATSVRPWKILRKEWKMAKRRLQKVPKAADLTHAAERLRNALVKRTKDELVEVLVELASTPTRHSRSIPPSAGPLDCGPPGRSAKERAQGSHVAAGRKRP